MAGKIQPEKLKQRIQESEVFFGQFSISVMRPLDKNINGLQTIFTKKLYHRYLTESIICL